MIPGMILGGILLFLLLILWIPLKIWLVYDGGLRIRLRVAFLSFPLYPREKHPEKKKATPKKKPTEKKPKKEPKQRSPLHIVKLILYILKRVCRRFPGCFTLTLTRLEILVGGPDAAQVAIRYGAVSQAVAYLTTLAERLLRIKTNKKSRLSVTPNFLGSKSDCAVDILLSTRVIYLLVLALHLLFAYRSGNRELSKSEQNT